MVRDAECPRLHARLASCLQRPSLEGRGPGLPQLAFACYSPRSAVSLALTRVIRAFAFQGVLCSLIALPLLLQGF